MVISLQQNWAVYEHEAMVISIQQNCSKSIIYLEKVIC